MGPPTPERFALPTAVPNGSLSDLLPVRHPMRHLSAYSVQPDPVERQRTLPIALWPEERAELTTCQRWPTRKT